MSLLVLLRHSVDKTCREQIAFPLFIHLLLYRFPDGALRFGGEFPKGAVVGKCGGLHYFFNVHYYRAGKISRVWVHHQHLSCGYRDVLTLVVSEFCLSFEADELDEFPGTVFHHRGRSRDACGDGGRADRCAAGVLGNLEEKRPLLDFHIA